ncbi:hypothetical protein HV346_20480 [Enterobacter sp. RHBSTW-00994]|uniref:hypothetical protein n=1 Tax=Enterobacter sp. RHBSTW-00994 TaxID=2742676 RepID=UPI0015EA4B85|nr:hypothetical protein [Enterobacter sp. RHBSTW-00994]QLR44893.1 hypothetical protein HV346_20480 [Enterobacter sp. RHBSTW-00994]
MKMQRLMGILFLLTLCLPELSHAEDCQITLSQPVVDYRQIRRDDIVKTQDSWHKMPEREVSVNVFCAEKKQMAVLVQGNAGEKGRFTFGMQGGLAVKVDNMIVDGKHYAVGKTEDKITFLPEAESSTPFYIKNNEAIIAVENNQIPFGQQMSFNVVLSPVINERAFSEMSDQTELESELAWVLLLK